MSSNIAVLPEPEPLRAVTVCRHVDDFDLLIEDMEAELPHAWGELSFHEAGPFLGQPEAGELEFVVVAVDRDDSDIDAIADVIRAAGQAGPLVILVADGLDPVVLHQLLRAGADEFTPYPLPEGALSEAMARLREAAKAEGATLLDQAGPDVVVTARALTDAMPATAPTAETAIAAPTKLGGTGMEGALFAVQAAAGGNGATTLVVNLAWELAHVSGDAPRVCVIDLGLQFGSVATYLDLDRTPLIYEVLSDISAMDEQAFRQALRPFRDRIDVFTAPADVLPMDIVGPEEIERLLGLARDCFDIVIVDMPGTLTSWTDTVLKQADIYFLVSELEVRSAQNALRFRNLLETEGLPVDRISHILNRAPGKMDLSGRARIGKMADSLGVTFHAVLPDGGTSVTDANDQALPLREAQPRNVLAKAVAKLAGDLHDAGRRIHAGEGARPAKKRGFLGLSFR
jgi:pilus assembly protein CpaE